MMSEFLMVPIRTNVEKTSAGMLTSAAPLSTVKSNLIAPFICTGTTNVPPAFFNGTAFNGTPALTVGVSFGTAAVRVHTCAGDYVAKILHGAKPSDLPIQRPERFDLVINLKTAHELRFVFR